MNKKMSELFLELAKESWLEEFKNDFRKGIKDMLKSNDEVVFTNKFMLNTCREIIDDIDIY